MKINGLDITAAGSGVASIAALANQKGINLNSTLKKLSEINTGDIAFWLDTDTIKEQAGQIPERKVKKPEVARLVRTESTARTVQLVLNFGFLNIESGEITYHREADGTLKTYKRSSTIAVDRLRDFAQSLKVLREVYGTEVAEATEDNSTIGEVAEVLDAAISTVNSLTEAEAVQAASHLL